MNKLGIGPRRPPALLSALFVMGLLIPSSATAAPSGAILDVYGPTVWVGGQSESVLVEVMNYGDDGNDLILEPEETPDGWDVWPWFTQEDVPAGTIGYLELDVTPPDDGGSGWLTWGLYYDDLGPWNTLLDTWSDWVEATPPGPNLQVSQVVLDPYPVALGHEVEIAATLVNTGSLQVADFLCIGGNVPVAFYLDGELLAEEVLSCGLDPGESDDEYAEFFADDPGPHVLEVWVDPWDDILELDETDNYIELTFDVAAPVLKVTADLPGVAPPGLSGLDVQVHIRNDSTGKIKDIYLALGVAEFGQLVDLGPADLGGDLLDLGWSQGSNLSPGEEVTWDAEIPLVEDIDGTAILPGDYTWRYRVLQGAIDEDSGGIPLTDWVELPLDIVPTVEVTAQDVVVPIVEPAVFAAGPVSEVTFDNVALRDGVFDAVLTFDPPVDFYAASTFVVVDALVGADVFADGTGVTICDGDVHARVVEAVLLWRDMVTWHPWYSGTYVAIQEGYEWYESEKHLKVLFWMTQPFVILQDVIKDMMAQGEELAQWVKLQVGIGDDEVAEGEASGLAFTASMLLTKGWSTLDDATKTVVSFSPLLAGEPYIDDAVIATALVGAIDKGGDDMDLAIELIHEAMKTASPEEFDSVADLLTPDLIKNVIGDTLSSVVGDVLKVAAAKGFQAFFLSKLTAATSWSVVIGEAQAGLMGLLTAAGAAKAIAAFGVALLVHTTIAYMTHVGTYVDNVRGPGGLIEVGQGLAQQMTWYHVGYDPDGSAGDLDVPDLERTFMSHAVLYEIHGFIHADLAMVKKLGFANTQSAEFMATSESLFGVSTQQRDLVETIEQTSEGVVSPACSDDPVMDPGDTDPPETDPDDGSGGTDEPAGDDSPWDKPPEAEDDGGGTTDAGDPGDGGGTTDSGDPGDGGGTTDSGDPSDGGGTTDAGDPGRGGPATSDPGTGSGSGSGGSTVEDPAGGGGANGGSGVVDGGSAGTPADGGGCAGGTSGTGLPVALLCMAGLHGLRRRRRAVMAGAR